MKKIFEKVPNASEVQKGIDDDTQRVLEDFAQKVVDAIKGLSKRSFTLSSNSKYRDMFHGIHGQKVKDALAEKGWLIQHISDQRDGDYFRITMNVGSGWQPMTD